MLWADRYSVTLGLHTGLRIERVTVTPGQERSWTRFIRPTFPGTKVMTWSLVWA